MDAIRHRFLLSEQAALNDLISRAPKSSVITRSSLASRLRDVEDELEQYEGLSPHLMEAELVFRGAPVSGSEGIWGDFGGMAVSDFSKAVMSVGASSVGTLSATGPVAGADRYRLLITGVTRGSFGFQIREESAQSAMFGESTDVELAVEQVKRILEASVGTDEQLAEAITNSDQRALGGIQTFLRTVSDHDAVCSLSYKGAVFSFNDPQQVKRSYERLGADYIKEYDVVLVGQFLGFFPVNPRAQFRITGGDITIAEGQQGQVIIAPVEPGMMDATGADTIQRLPLTERTVRVAARARSVGSGRPRYVLTGWVDPISDIFAGLDEQPSQADPGIA